MKTHDNILAEDLNRNFIEKELQVVNSFLTKKEMVLKFINNENDVAKIENSDNSKCRE